MNTEFQCRIHKGQNGEKKARTAFKTLTDTPTATEYLGRPRRRWEDNIRIDLNEKASIRGIGLIWNKIWIIGEPL